MKETLKQFFSSSWFRTVVHLVGAILLGTIIVLTFFNIYLPTRTNHGETITVPNVIGVHMNDLDEFLTQRKLRYEITTDSSYSADYQPLEVLKQFPLANAKVKENRKVYLTLNKTNPPLVKMPNLVDGSIKSAQLVLRTYDLKVGRIEYIPEPFFGTIIDQKYKGRPVAPGELIPKGSTIDIVAADGMGVTSLQSPNLVGLDEESAKVAIVGSGLKVGQVTYQEDGEYVTSVESSDGSLETVRKSVSPGEVAEQSPKAGESVRIEDVIDIWVYRPDSINTKRTILDE
ncbi:MAG: PASTA domain-containing protein [Bacteroidota bacterium]